ncbi:MAG: regulatory protein RecX [Thermaceae bacterium]|nr:regulatory protein RecX [Thermaceae bacterium]
MKEQSQEELFAYAIRVLAARAYSESVLRRKLARRGQTEVVNKVIAQVKGMGYLEDAQYAEGYARMYAGRWGAAKIRKGLLEKGVNRAVIDRVLAQIEPETDAVAEALALLERYTTRHKGNKPRAVRFLVGRGYALGDALEAWKRYEGRGEG